MNMSNKFEIHQQLIMKNYQNLIFIKKTRYFFTSKKENSAFFLSLIHLQNENLLNHLQMSKTLIFSLFKIYQNNK